MLRLDVSSYVLGGALLFYGRGTVLLLVVLFGYLKRVVEFDPSEETVPAFDDWAGLLADGTRLLVIWLVYFVTLPLLGVLLVERNLLTEGVVGEVVPVFGKVTLALITGAVEGRLVPAGDGGRLVYTVVVGGDSYSLSSAEPVVLALVLAYVYPAAVLQYTKSGSLWSAFRFGSFRSHLESPRYAVQWTAFMVLSLVGLYLLARAGSWAKTISDAVWTFGGEPILLSNEVGELAVFVFAVLSFQSFVLAYYVLGRRTLPTWWERVAATVTRYDSELAKVVLGGVLLSLGITPSLVPVLGYLSKVYERARMGDGGLPAFEGWWELVARGLYLVGAWAALVSVPWAILLLGQGERTLATKPTGIAADLGNALVGATALPVGPPVAFQLDRGIGDVLRIVGFHPTADSYGVGDPTQIPVWALVAFVITLLSAWIAFVLVVAALTERRVQETPFRETVGRLLAGDRSIRDPGFRRRLRAAAVWWTAGGLPFVGWYVWRRSVRGGSELVPLTFAPLGTTLLVPNPFSLVSILSLFVVSLWNFYALTRAYRRLGATPSEANSTPSVADGDS